MSLERRLRRLESEHADLGETAAEREERRRRIREDADRCRDADEPLLFEVTGAGDVLCARDGRPVTDSRQVLAERFYWMEVGFGGFDLVHDEEQTFYSEDGDLAVSRDRVDFRHLMGPGRG